MKQTFLIISVTFFLIACSTTKPVNKKPQGLQMSDAKPNIYNCQLIEKEFVNKGGKITTFKELYLRCSVQDYFIKLCESNLTRDELEPYINKGISVEVEIKDGLWDHCSENVAEVQSRMGTYVVIKSIQ